MLKKFSFAPSLAVLLAGTFCVAYPTFAQDAVSPRKAAEAADSTATTTPAKKTSTRSTTKSAVTESTIVVRGEEVTSAYGAPPALSRSRFSNLVNAYVLPPFGVYAAAIFEGDAQRFDRPDYSYTAEVEMGLPNRFGIAIENEVETYRGTTQERSFSFEARYALADWDKFPLNPTLFLEYKIGIGHILHDEGPPAPPAKGEQLEFLHENNPLPDAIEGRLLLSEVFFEKIEWAFNAFLEQENGGDRGRELGFAQSAMVPVILPRERLKVGAEMQLTTFSDKGIRGDPSYRFIIGPTIAWKPSKNTRFDVSPLFGATYDAPKASVFAVFSYVFGGSEGTEAEAPASTRNR